MKRYLYLLCLLSIPSALTAQAPDAEEVEGSILWTINEVNRLISAEKGEARDFDALRELFIPGCLFMVTSPDPEATEPLQKANLDEFIELLHEPYYENGYFETAIGEVIEEYNGIAHAFQAFYGKDSEGDEARGINSIQLVRFKGRWLIASMLWTVETPAAPIPAKYVMR